MHSMLLQVNQQHLIATRDGTEDDADVHPAAAAASLMPQGVSPNQMLTVASLLENYPGLLIEPGDLLDNSWLWEGDVGETVGSVE